MQTVGVSPTLAIQFQYMPAALYQTALQHKLMATELGQNETEHDTMLAKAENQALTEKLEEFKEQMRNYRLAKVLTKDNFQAGQLDWACHVHSVNEERPMKKLLRKPPHQLRALYVYK